MNALPALTTIATDAIRAQFAEVETPEHDRRPSRSVSRSRVALAGLLERAARAVAPAGRVAAH